MAEKIAAVNNVITVVPFKSLRVGIITTGSEIYQGRIADKFGPVVREKAEAYGSTVIDHIIVPDDKGRIAKGLKKLISAGAN